MNLKVLKKNAHWYAYRLGVVADPRITRGSEQPASWYDRDYAVAEMYHCHYAQSCYYPAWSVIADRLVRDGHHRILDIGCGPGQFAALLKDQGIECYAGLDFSETALAMARTNVPDFLFVHGDARTSTIYQETHCDALICTEVLEHIEADLEIVSRFPRGVRCLCTVPNFPHTSHVRHFENMQQVETRYGKFFETFHVTALRGTRMKDETLFLFDGVRNSRVETSQSPSEPTGGSRP